DRLDEYTEPSAAHLAVLDELLHDGPRHVRRHGETDADIAAGRRDDRGVDADEQAVHREQRAARIARIDRSVRLDEILVALAVGHHAGAPERADDAVGHRLAEAERVTDRDDEVADLELTRVAHPRRDEVLGLDLEQRDIRRLVAADELRREAALIRERYDDFLRVLHDVMVREHVAFFRVDDHARAHALPRHDLRIIRDAEEAAKERVVEQRAGT